MRKIGINNFRFKGAPWKDQLSLAQKIDQLGFNSISMGESWGEDSLTSLAQIAAVTSNIKFGTSIVPTYGRTPANLAMTALNMDKMSRYNPMSPHSRSSDNNKKRPNEIINPIAAELPIATLMVYPNIFKT